MRHIILALPRNLAMGSLWPLERTLLSGSENAAWPPIFVVGPPRSGTTLVYDAMIGVFRFAYISNLAHRLYRTPVAASQLGRRALERYTPVYESKWGHVDGWAAPNEGGWVWERWFRSHDEADGPEPAGAALESMRRTVRGLSRVMGAPFINKNVNHSVWIPLLARVFPDAAFVEIDRDPLATAGSMLKARVDEIGERGAREWMSVKPRGWREFESDSPEVQCVAQALLVKRQIDDAVRTVGEERRLTVRYEAFCENPSDTLGVIEAFLRSRGAEVSRRAEAPAPFQARGGGRRHSDEFGRALAEVERRLGCARQSVPAIA